MYKMHCTGCCKSGARQGRGVLKHATCGLAGLGVDLSDSSATAKQAAQSSGEPRLEFLLRAAGRFEVSGIVFVFYPASKELEGCLGFVLGHLQSQKNTPFLHSQW